MRLDLLSPTVKTTDLYLIHREYYSKNTHPSSFLERIIDKLIVLQQLMKNTVNVLYFTGQFTVNFVRQNQKSVWKTNILCGLSV